MQFTQYEISFYKGGPGMVGRPVNPYPVPHELYFEFEDFANQKTFWCTSECSPGIFEKAWIYPLMWEIWTDEGQDPEQIKTESELPIEIHEELDVDGSTLYHYFVYDKLDKIPSIPITFLVN